MLEEAGEQVAEVRPHVDIMLELVAAQNGMSGAKAHVWVGAVRDKMMDVGVDTLQDLIWNILPLN